MKKIISIPLLLLLFCLKSYSQTRIAFNTEVAKFQNITLNYVIYKQGRIDGAKSKGTLKLNNGAGEITYQMDIPSTLMVIWYQEKKGVNQRGEFMIDTGSNAIQLDMNKKGYMLTASKHKSDRFFVQLDSVKYKLSKAKTEQVKLNEIDKVYQYLMQYPNDYFGLVNFYLFSNSVNANKYPDKGLSYFQTYSKALKESPLGKALKEKLSTKIAGDKAVK